MGVLGMNSISSTYSIIELESHCCLLSRQWRPSLWYKWLFSHSSSLFSVCWVRLLKHITGQREQPSVQQQHTQPQNSHFTFTGSVFLRTALIRMMVALNSSGATRDTKPAGNCALKRLLKPKTVIFPAPRMMIGSGTICTCASSTSSGSASSCSS